MRVAAARVCAVGARGADLLSCAPLLVTVRGHARCVCRRRRVQDNM